MRLWYYLTIIGVNIKLSFKEAFVNPFSAFMFITGKIVRFGLFIFFLVFLFRKVPPIAGFDFYDLVFYFLVFNLIDSLAQWLMRGAYMFDSRVYNGEYDYIRLYPVNTLVYSLFSYIDPLDLATLPVFIGYFIYFVKSYYVIPPPVVVVGFVIALLLSLIAVAGLHIMAMAAGFKSPVTGELLWVWRNLSQMGRVPTKIYHQTIYWVLTYIIPVTLIINLPAAIWRQEVGLTSLVWVGLVDGFILTLGVWLWSRWQRGYKSVSS